jgi:hypothetical protein
MSAGTITAVKPNPKNPAQGFAKIALPDGSELEAWTPEFPKAEALNGKPIPDDWSLRDNKQGTGKVLLPPKERGQTAYRNTKEAFEAEAASRLAWQQVEEERKDRRTALMTAIEMLGKVESGVITREVGRRTADWMYDWLRSSPAVSEPVAERDVASTVEQTAESRPKHGAPAAPDGQAGDTSSVSPGEVGTDPEPGEGSAIGKASPGFPIDPAKCNHKTAAGHWVKWIVPAGTKGIGSMEPYAVCPKCGTSKLVAMEGTTADLGPA